jgi:hypothetical protein
MKFCDECLSLKMYCPDCSLINLKKGDQIKIKFKKEMIDVNRKVETIGLDIDGFDKLFLDKVQRNAAEYGNIQTTKSKNGNHVKIDLFVPTTLKNSLWIRFYLNDDPLRILFDALRIISGNDNLDVLWDIKEKKLINSIRSGAKQ